MVIKEALEYGRENLRLNEYTDPINESVNILSFLIGKDKSFIHSYLDFQLDKGIVNQYKTIIGERKKGVPLAYILNQKYFYDREFYVDSRVLIPRGDTEILLGHVLEYIDQDESASILEIGTGSGALSIVLSDLRPMSSITACDISRDALDVASINKRKYNISNLELVESDLYKGVDGIYDIIISNPPYISKGDMEVLQLEVKNEPKVALYGGEDGLDIYRRIIKDSKDFLKTGGMLVMELGYDQYDQVKDLMEKSGYENISYKKDLQNYKRTIGGRFVGRHKC